MAFILLYAAVSVTTCLWVCFSQTNAEIRDVEISQDSQQEVKKNEVKHLKKEVHARGEGGRREKRKRIDLK